jgi:putative flippase GtrA
MSAIGMFALGGFVGFVITFCLLRVKDWSKVLAILSGAISAAVATSLFTFLERQSGGLIGASVFYYPLGLAYGAITTRLEWLGTQGGDSWVRKGHAVAWGLFTVVMIALFLFPEFRARLPT